MKQRKLFNIFINISANRSLVLMAVFLRLQHSHIADYKLFRFATRVSFPCILLRRWRSSLRLHTFAWKPTKYLDYRIITTTLNKCTVEQSSFRWPSPSELGRGVGRESEYLGWGGGPSDIVPRLVGRPAPTSGVRGMRALVPNTSLYSARLHMHNVRYTTRLR